MATFKDKTGQEWAVSLDPIVIQEIKAKHGVSLVDLEADPMLKLTMDPFLLVAVMYLICQEQVEAKNLTPEQFAKRLPFPPDPMLDAIRESIIDFFPVGRSSHVREVLANFDKIAEKVDEMQRNKMKQLLENRQVEDKINAEADRAISVALDELFQSKKPSGSISAEAKSFT